MNDTTAVILRWALARLPHDEIGVDGDVYMRRWYLAGYAPPRPCATCEGTGWLDRPMIGGEVESRPCPICDDEPGCARRSWWWRWRFGAIRLHEIVRSDDARAFHDHPWNFISIGLTGSYTEEKPHFARNGACARVGAALNERRRYTAPWLIRRKATDLHVLWLDYESTPVWTLVLMGRKRRSWGFCDPYGWIGWREFDERHPQRHSGSQADVEVPR